MSEWLSWKYLHSNAPQGYLVYDVTPVVSGPELFVTFNVTFGVVQQLTPNYTAVEPAYEVTDLTNIEAWDIWYRDGWWYLTVSSSTRYVLCTF